jgi:hypothetical protein
MLILADNDVIGAVAALQRVLQSDEWAEYAASLDLRFIQLEDLELSRTSSDQAVWQACQDARAVLITANRSGGAEALETVIDELSGPESLPVFTLADPQMILRDSAYAETTALRLLDYLERLSSLRGTRRLYSP